MRKVVLTSLLSLDGVADEPHRFFHEWDEAVDANGESIIATQDTVLLGRRTYDDWAALWPTSDVEPFASFINKAPKHIATSTPLTQPWDNATAIPGDLTEFVQDLKHSAGADIGIHGSITLGRSLLAAGLVDELRLTTAPAIAGEGRRLLTDLPATRLELLRSVTSPAGYLITDYRVSR